MHKATSNSRISHGIGQQEKGTLHHTHYMYMYRWCIKVPVIKGVRTCMSTYTILYFIRNLIIVCYIHVHVTTEFTDFAV